MARKSKMAAVKTADVQPGNGSELDINAEANWQLNHELANASPDPLAPEPHNLRHQTPVANMGAEGSKITSDDIRAAGAKIKQQPVTETERVSTGKLTAPSVKAKNPAYRNPVPSTQRKLVSAYDVHEDTELTKAHRADREPEFSPLKKQRNRTKRGGEAVAEATVGVDEEAEELGAQDVEAQLGIQEGDALMTDFFPDVVTRRFQQELEAAAAAGAANEEEFGENIRVASPEERAAGDEALPDTNTASQGEASKRTKRGRPKNVSAEPSTPPQTTTKRKPGRPKKSIPAAREPEEPEEVPEAPQQPEEPEDPNPAESGVRRSPRKSKGQAGVASSSAPAKAPATHSTRSKKSEARETARENLLRRYSQVDPDDQPDDEDAEGVEEDEEQDDGDLLVPDDRSSREQLPGPSVDFARPSQVQFPDAGGESTQASSSSKSKKRSAQSQIEPNTAKKRTHGRPARQEQGEELYEDPDEEAEDDVEEQAEEDVEGDAESGPSRLYGQWQNFKRALKFADCIGRNPKEDLNDNPLRYADVKATHQLCNNAIQRYKALRTQNETVVADQDPINLLIEIGKRVDGLRGNNDDFPTDFTKKTKAKEIYFHVIRKLPRLMKAVILYYEPTNADGAEAGQLKMGHVKLVMDLIDMTLGLIDSAHEYPRPPSHLRVIMPAEKMRKPLSEIRTALARRTYHSQLDEQAAQQRQQDRLGRIAREEEAARRRQQEARARLVREKWQKLHYERSLAEGGLMSNAKRIHLQLPNQYHTEMDYNGLPFEREEVFAPRVGPPPDLVAAAAMRQWSMVQLTALKDGLKDYTGPNVYERIFWKYCRPKGELNRFNVTEIVVEAALVKDWLTRDQREKYGDVEEWITAIPVWSKAFHGAGLQENEGGEGDGSGEGEYMMSGSVADA